MRLLFLFRQAWKLGPALATGNVVVMKVIAIVVLSVMVNDITSPSFTKKWIIRQLIIPVHPSLYSSPIPPKKISRHLSF